ncbi:MAG: type II toxin-antitoxin system RelE/ParE family toxin [Sedimentisphaeraceae bacterium JB056]
MYKIELTKEPEKFYLKQNKNVQKKLSTALRKLASNPTPNQSKKLSGMDGLFRLRAGDYRVIYKIENDKLIILVVRIAHRKDVYRKL